MGKVMVMSLVLALIFGSMGGCLAEVHIVGDLTGWTDVGVNYNQWARSRIFHFGDKLVFHYENRFDNVVQVNKDDYDKCKIDNPIAAYNSGLDTILITARKGHYFFISATWVHCEAGQKLHIRIVPDQVPTNATPPQPLISSHHKIRGGPVSSPPLNSPSPTNHKDEVNDDAVSPRPLNFSLPSPPPYTPPLNPIPSPAASLATKKPDSSHGSLVSKRLGLGAGFSIFFATLFFISF